MTAPVYNACYVGGNQAIRKALADVWDPAVANWTFFDTGREATGVLLTSPPDILLCSMTLPDMSGIDVARLLKEENVYSQVPVVMCLSPEEAEAYADWHNLVADDFFVFPCPIPVIRARLDLAMGRATRTLDANPLSRLPGNTSIIKHTQGLIDKNQDFALGYCDLDYFKPFNDKYGFARGDEVLMMTSRIILNSVHDQALPFSFVGHIGGDDFVFIVPVGAAEAVSKKIVSAFDAIIPQFYDAEDLAKGCIVSVDRQNNVCTFPLMAISVAVVFNRNGNLKHYGEASSLAMGLKKVAKKSVTSSYALDQRRS
ncbi:Response regulator receiver modulated diguanylate cyclase [uncultured delta proteobacterium]|uniref:Response regulator receiver modulated diguanylate cyclase n=1 Tax=uncultured delta proteobacterium TaxID=34034 RepID=A0A212J8D1_9DELT|nr:Response regulator receiver modulated diguanylate cyclase [uncultured delta proteobacterium]